MYRKKIAFVLVFLFAFSPAFSEQKEQSPVEPRHFSLSLGTGWTHYIDNLDYGNKNLNKDFAGLSFRFFWEPEYRLSLGAETGSYTMFKVKSQPGSGTTGDITRKVIPMLLLARMRFVDNFYIGTGFGLAMLTNTAKGAGEKIVTNTLSLANYQFSASYIYPLSARWQLGGEVKLFDFGAYNDWMYSLQAFCAYRF
jgi:hypothetical protein